MIGAFNPFTFKVTAVKDGSVGKESACSAGNAGEAGSVPGSGRAPGAGHGSSFQYSCLENPDGLQFIRLQRV